MALKPATLVWTEALDGGDPEKDVPFRDRLVALPAPFAGEPAEVIKLKERAQGLSYFDAPGLALASEFNWKKRWRTTWLVDLDHPQSAPRKFFDLSIQDQYNDPGYPVTTTLKTGERVILYEKGSIYLSGSGASPKGDHPFLDRMDLKTMKKERLFQCQDPSYETFIAFDGASRDRIITSCESKTEPPNYYVHDLKSRKRKALTGFKDPAPELTAVKKELVTYKRDDGVELSGTLYLPADWKPGTRLPVVIWAYPLEYGDRGTAGQVRGSANRFTFYRGTSELFFVTQGYAVLDNATMPVIGDPKTVNDTFVQQIVANAKAAIRKLDEMGVGDPKRVGVGGHSYGAFMTANLLAHCDLFAAGIARSGAYNRTLTPFGFQSERRTLWEAPDTYIKMSPVHVRRQDQDAAPPDPRRSGQQLGHLSHPVGAPLRRPQGVRRDGPARHAPLREPRLLRPRVGPRCSGRNVRVVRPLREEQEVMSAMCPRFPQFLCISLWKSGPRRSLTG